MGCGASASSGPPRRKYMIETPDTVETPTEEEESGNVITSDVDNKGFITDFYTFDNQLLSKGAVSSVRRVTHRTKNQPRALKQFNLKKCLNSDALKEQTNLMVSLGRHTNIVRLYETFEDKLYYYMLFEYCAGGKLFDHIIEAESHTERETASVMQQILRALDHMHGNSVCHRDIKPEHVVLKAKGNLYGCTAKIIDLNCACYVSGPETRMSHKELLDKQRFYAGGEVTHYYDAPEVTNDNFHAMNSDCWSCGVIMYLLLFGFPKARSKSKRRLSLTRPTPASMVKDGKFMFDTSDWDGASEGAKALIASLLETDPWKRMPSRPALNHEWVKRQAPQPANARVQAKAGGGFPTTRVVEVDLPPSRDSTIED